LVPGLKNQIISAKLLAGGNVKTKSGDGGMTISVPAKAPDAIASVIKIEVKGEVANVNLVAKDKMKTGALD
jgi:alpha-L-fucosidase